ncbi:filamentous hemagglutinin N-terminal domain-containing protein [Photorhabdus laumondii subsp. laumondii]|uniref:Filamentous hemagglutinin N-terminal domain-containing protein n=1 Tax=Photorhabdus laumondii subsp. laumondii TaxID=141679 RepID=A0A6L9JSG2_PHOLM|nr:hemagglutinin repeat-containing protein [Photorhabdus laumondii]NDK96152.1 filamentous hemagglutinin N-terminal domain-containing protein [Photorhabdus laumondii subsp. laumondii]MCC8414471.1 hemagglutinin repeat-containing protein [Photorhabdus laumondii]NDL19664.1 filamentous hemagglutinin N-terminal domain-containing protein [Photorhabdus laumondii subsp. laumondii]NDL33246.1 filamentous hemagglutinin N-terminal domain-containing protein [Photorhabdus laumondii subsp. laumondii]NDL40546.
MNKHLYRIIFNKARNMLMVVADIATSGQGSTVRRRSRRQSPQCLCRLTALRLSLLLATGCISLTAQANIVADGQAPGNQQPTILNSANGTPQIDIQTPNAAGISRNTYSQFDIDKRGVILNNSHNAVQTQLGGMVAGNPWLAKAEAKIILNEVNSINASKLNGWIEVAGQKANVIIANPAGITCNGCGFINAHRATLTTGQAMMEQGRLKGFDIDRGEVRIEGLGLDSSQQNYTEIIARSVVINGKLHAKDLKITTGRNIVDAAHQNIEKKSADGSENPSFTLDVAALGGMYANKIMLVGTEFGVGVRNAGHIGATAGEVRLTVDGLIENSGTIAARSNTIIKAESIQSASGSTLSAGIDNKGKATLPGSLTLTAKQHIQANGKNLATNTLEAQSKKIDLSGSQTSANNIQLTASQQEISTANATVTADRFTAKAPGQFNNDGGTLVAREINLTTPDLSNNQGKINQTGNGELVLNTQTLNNQSGTLLNEGKRLAITTRNLDNRHGKIANNGNDLNLTVHEKADNTEGGTIQLAGKGKLSLNTHQWIGDGGELLSNGELDIQAHNLQLNKKAVTTADKITIKTDTLSHQSGVMQQNGKDKMSLTAKTLNNQNGEIKGNGNLKINATTLDNSKGKIVATGGSTELIIEKNIENVDGRIETKTELTTKSQALNNHQGSLLAQRIDSQTKGHKFTNTAGQVIAQEKLTLNSGELDNTSGLLQSDSDMIVNTHGQKLTNTKDTKNGDEKEIKKGTILSKGNLELRTGDINNTAGIISAKGKTTLNAGNVDNTDGQLLSQQMAELTTQALDNTRGQIQSESSLLLDTQNQALTNTDSGKTGGIIAKDSLRISSGNLTNNAGVILGHGIHIDTHEQRLSNQKGTIASKKNLQLDSGELDSTSGQIKSDGDMTLDTHGKKLTTAKSSDTGGVTSKGALTLKTGEIDNHDGTITGTGTTTITGGELHNQRGKLVSKTGPLTLTVNNTDNSGGLLQSAGDLTLDTKSGLLTNTNSGKDRGIISIGNMKLTTQGVNNDAGLIHAGKNLILDGQKGTITNRNSQPNQGIRSSGDLTLTASAIDNHQGSVEADKQLTVTSGIVDNTGGLLKSGTTLSLNTQGQKLTNAQSGEKRGIRSGSDLKLEAGEIDNTAGLIDAQGETSLTSQNLNNTSGKILSRKKADLTTQTVNNQSGLIQSATSLKLDTQQNELTSTDGGIIAEEALELATGKLINDRGSIRGDQTHINTHQQALNNVAGTIFSKKNLKLDSGELNSTGGRIESTGDMTLTTGDIDNQDGVIIGTGTTTVTGGELKNQGGTLASETNTLTLTVKKTDNSGGLLKSAGDLTLDTQGELLTNLNSGKTGGIISAGNVKLTAQGINNEAGWIHADKNLTLDGQQGKITNRNSQPKQGISSQGELTITAGAIDNQQGRIIADKQLNVTSTGAVDNTSGKMVSQHQQLTMNTGELNNTSGLLQSKTTLYLNTHGQKLTNTQSGDDLGIRSDSDLTLEAGEIDNTAGKIDSQGKTTLTSQNLNNTDGKILSKGKADLTTQAVNNQRGLIQSSASLKLDTQQHELTNTDSGKNGIVAEDALELTTGKLINDRGDIRGNETHINTHQQALNNLAGTIFSKKNLQLDSGELNSTGGRIESTGDMILDTHGKKLTTAKSDKTSGVISNGTLTLTTGEIDNQDGFIKGTGTTTVTGGDLKNQGGTLASETGSLTLTVKKTDNSGGLLKSAGDLTLDTQGELLTNLNSGKTGGIIGTGNVKLTTQGINNEAGWIHADKNLTLDGKQGKITNRNSQPKQGITSQGELTITAGAIDNQQGRVIADKQLNVTSTGTVDNTSGKILSQNQQLTMNTGELNNTSGLLQSKTTLYLNTHGQKLTNTQSGDDLGIRSDSDLTLEAGEIDNTAGKIDSQGETKLTSQNLNNTDGKILSKGKADLTTQAVNNQRGLIQSSASLKLDTQQQKLTNTDSGEFNGILALDSLKLITGELINDLGYIRGDETHINSHQQTLSNLTGTIVSKKNLKLDSGELDSTGGLIKSDGNMTIDTHGKKLTTAKSGDTRGVISEGTMTLTADEIDNQDGFIKGTGTTIVTGGELKNQGGTLISEKGSLTLSVNQTDNSGGLLQSAGKLTLDTHGHSLTNKNSGDRGGIRSQDDMLITSGDLHNQAGTITNRKIATVNNLQNTIVGTQQIKLITQAFNNQQGKVHSDGNLNLNTQGQRLNNTGDKDKSGEFSAQGDLTLDIGELNNDASFIAADGKTKITSTTLTNKKGLIAGNSGLEIHSQTLTNNNGSLKSANTVNIDTNGQLLDNQHGRIIGDDNTTVTSGKLNNQHGHIQGKKLTIDTGQADTDNQDGKLLSTDTMNLNTLQLDNRRGQVKAIGDATINAPTQTNNTGGLIHSDQQLTLKTAELINRETHHPDQGTEAQDLIIEAQQIDNTQGTLQGANHLQAIINQSLKNEQGLISGGKQLTIEDKTQKLTVNNRQGTLTGSEKVKIKANALSGDGQILSQGDIEVKLKQDFHNTGNIAADGKLSLETDGNIINDSTMKAEQAYLEAQNLTNTQTAEIRAKQTEVNVRNTLTNTGLIDGELTHLTANKVLDNTGTGRIYGDQIALKTGTLNNTAKDGKAAVIAARDRLDIGTGTLNNSNHAQIYSVGDMRIGGQLDENLAATSQAGRLSNHAATIEAGGSLKIDAAIIKNTNNGLVTDIVETEKSQRHEAVLSGRTARYDWSQVNTSRRNKYGVHRAVMPDGSGSEEFYEYRYTRTINETQIKESDPGKILSGGNMTINSAMLTNDDSQIVAGGILGGDIDELHNNATKGERIITDEGSEIRWYAKKKKRRFRGTKTSQGKDWDHYNPAPITETIDLKALAWQGNTRPNSTGITIDDRQTSRVQSTPTGINLTSRMAEAGEVTFTNATINAITLPNRDIPTDRPLLSPTGQQTEQLLSSGAVALPSRDALTEHPILSPTGQQTEQVLSSGAVVLPNRDALTEHPVLPPVQQTERVLPPVTVTLPNSGPLDERPLVLPTGQQFELTLPSDTVQGQSVEPLIRIVAPDTRLPANSLFVVQPGSDSHYLVETDPKFTQYKKWLGTDYMQQQLTHDPVLAHKRLGDGFYEQRLVRDQITQLTGQRYLAGHHNDETQFKALMEAGVAFSKQQQLTPGIALSPSQMALLTSDIIWLTNRTVTLPDGTTQVVAVPQVYARVNKGDLTGDGALLSGKNVTINSRRDITNSGTISGREVTQLAASNLTNSGFIQSGKVDLTARQDITNLGGQIRGRDRVSAQADRDITSASTLRGAGADRWQDRPAGIYVQNDNGTLSLKALNNIHLTASDVENAGKDGQTEITAGLDLTLDTLRTHRTENSDWGSDNYRHLTQQHDVGSQITTAGNLALRAGNNLNATAANVNAGQQLTAQAGNNITLNTGTASSDLIEHSKQTSKGLLSKSSVETHDEVHERRAQSTTLSGDRVTLQTGNDLNIIGSNVAGTQDVNLAAGNQLTITTADEARHETHFKQEKKSGLMGTGGIGFSVGKASQKSTTDIDSNLNKGSTVGSSQGSVTFSAGKQLNIHGSDVVAGRDTQLSGQNIHITSAENSHTAITKTEQKQSGLTVALSGTAGGALNSAVQTVQAANNESDSRIKALQGTKAALSGVQAVQAARLADAKGGDDKANNNLVGVNLSYGRQSSRSEQKQHQTTQQGSSLMTGDNLTLTASGTPNQHGDIRIQGGQLQAGKDLQLNASRDIQLSSSQNTEQTTGKNSSRGGSLGVGFTAGPGGTGINLSASTHRGKGRESGNGVSHNETTLDAGQTVTLNAGRDASLKGAQVSGEQITADVKRHLTLSSEQDSNRYDMKQQNVSAGVSVTLGPQPGGSLNLSASRDKIHSNFDSVQEQTGLFAGKGGYQVKVGEHTQLDGAVIASTADKDKNTLDTGTLGFGDIKNKADFKTEHHSASISTGGSAGGMFLSNLAANTLGGANREGHAQSTTHAAVSDGTLIIRDKDHQQQDVTTLSRDTDHANNALSPIFDKEKEQQRLKQAQLIGEISAQVIDIAGTEGAIIATKAAHAKLENISDPDREAAIKVLKDKGKTDITPALIKDQIYKTAYNAALNESGLGTGGKYHTALQAATAAIQGLAGGNIGQALAGGASPYLAGVIKDLTTDPKTHQVDVVTNTLAHAILGAVAAEVSGNNALAGAAGAAGGELAARELMKHIHGENAKVSDLSEEEKQTISTLSTLAAGLAGGIAGDSTASALTGAQAGKNAVENNYLSVNELDSFAHQARTCEGESCKQVIKDMVDTNIRNQQEMMDFCNSNPTQCAQKYGYLVDQWPVFERTLKNMDRDGTLPVEFRNYLSAVNTLGQAATGKVGELGWTKRFEAMGMSQETAAAMAMTLPIVMEGAKGPKSSPKSSQNNAGKDAQPELAGKNTSGAENAATYPKLKEDLVQRNLSHIASQDPRLAAVVKGDNGKLNYGIGTGTRTEADRLGKIWVGDGAKKTTGNGWVSADGTRGYRPPSEKPNSAHATTGVQANFETYSIDSKGKINKTGNGHLNILD